MRNYEEDLKVIEDSIDDYSLDYLLAMTAEVCVRRAKRLGANDVSPDKWIHAAEQLKVINTGL